MNNKTHFIKHYVNHTICRPTNKIKIKFIYIQFQLLVSFYACSAFLNFCLNEFLLVASFISFFELLKSLIDLTWKEVLYSTVLCIGNSKNLSLNLVYLWWTLRIVGYSFSYKYTGCLVINIFLKAIKTLYTILSLILSHLNCLYNGFTWRYIFKLKNNT